MHDFNPFSEEGKAWLDYNLEEDEFGALENLGHGRTRSHSRPKRRTRKRTKKVNSYVKESGSDDQGDFVVFGGKRKTRRKSRKRFGGTKIPKNKKSSSGNSTVTVDSDKASVQTVTDPNANTGPQKVPIRNNNPITRNPYKLGIAKRGGKRRKSRKRRRKYRKRRKSRKLRRTRRKRRR